MPRTHKVRALLMVGALAAPLGLEAVMSTAKADAANHFTCRASVLRVDFQGPLNQLPTVEPFIANAQNDPCTDATSGVIPSATLPGGLGTLSALYAQTDTDQQGVDNGTFSAARAGVLDLTLNLPAPIGTVHAEVLTSSAQAGPCDGSGNPPALSGESTVLAVDILGQHIEPIGSTHQHFPLPVQPPGPVGPVTLHVNHQSTTSNSITQRALFLETGLVDVVIAESIADFTGNPCANGNGDRLPGWMTGGGYVAEPGTKQDHNGEGTVDPGTKVQHAFSIDCFFPTAEDAGKKDHLSAQWFDTENKEHSSFKLVELIDAECTNDPAAGSPNPPTSSFNTVKGSGVGMCRSGGVEAPATIEFRFTDGGEPRNDQADITVTSPAPAPLDVLCSYEERGFLDGGNHQAHQTKAQRTGATSGPRGKQR